MVADRVYIPGLQTQSVCVCVCVCGGGGGPAVIEGVRGRPSWLVEGTLGGVGGGWLKGLCLGWVPTVWGGLGSGRGWCRVLEGS